MPASTRTITLDAKFRDQMTKGVQRASTQSSAAFKTLVTSVVAPIAGFFAIRSLAATGLDLADLAAEADGVSRSFQNLAKLSGQTADVFLTDLRAAARGTISDLELMKKSNEAALLAGESIIKRLPELIEIARASAAATGQSVEFLFQSIVLGIGRQSKLILDNLGIIVQAEKANKEYAAALGTTANKLTEAERKQAFLNATVKAGKKIIEDTGSGADLLTDASARLAAEQENLRLSIGKKLLPTITKLRANFSGLLKIIDNLIPEEDKLGDAQKLVAESISELNELARQRAELQAKGKDATFGEIALLGVLTRQEQDLLAARKEAQEFIKSKEESEKEKPKPEDIEALTLEDAKILRETKKNEILAEMALTQEDLLAQIARAGEEERLALVEKAAKREVDIIKNRNATITQISVAQAVLLGKIGEAVGRNEQAIGRKLAVQQIKLLKEIIGGRLQAQQIAAVGAALSNPAGLLAAIPQIALITAKFSALRAALGIASGAAISAIQAPAEVAPETPSALGGVDGLPDGGGATDQATGDGFASGMQRERAVIQQELDELEAKQIELNQEISREQNQLGKKIADISLEVARRFGVGRRAEEERAIALQALRDEQERLFTERTQTEDRIATLLEELSRGGAGGQLGQSIEINLTVQALDPTLVDWDDIVANNIAPAFQNNIDNASINLIVETTT